MGYGRLGPRVEAFLGSRGSPASRLRAPRQLSALMCRGFTYDTAYNLRRGLPPPRRATFLRHPCSHAYLLPDQVPNHEHTPPRRATCTRSMGQYHWPWYGRSFAGTGISTRHPSTTPVGLALGPDLPRADEPGPGTLGHSADGFLTRHSLLMPAFSLAWPPPLDHSAASPATRRSPTRPHT